MKKQELKERVQEYRLANYTIRPYIEKDIRKFVRKWGTRGTYFIINPDELYDKCPELRIPLFGEDFESYMVFVSGYNGLDIIVPDNGKFITRPGLNKIILLWELFEFIDNKDNWHGFEIKNGELTIKE